jgi:hypothetical protein
VAVKWRCSTGGTQSRRHHLEFLPVATKIAIAISAYYSEKATPHMLRMASALLQKGSCKV